MYLQLLRDPCILLVLFRVTVLINFCHSCYDMTPMRFIHDAKVAISGKKAERMRKMTQLVAQVRRLAKVDATVLANRLNESAAQDCLRVSSRPTAWWAPPGLVPPPGEPKLQRQRALLKALQHKCNRKRRKTLKQQQSSLTRVRRKRLHDSARLICAL